MQDFVVPKHEPQVVRFIARKLYGGDEAQVPDTMLRSCPLKGVRMESTGRQSREYGLMAKIVYALAEDDRDVITDLICHSDDGFRFSVRAQTKQPSVAADVAAVIHQTCLKHLGGHGGIDVITKDGSKTSMIAQWDGRMDAAG